MSGNKVSCAVVTTAYERRDHLGVQLASLAHQTRPADRIVIVDLGGSPIERHPALGPTSLEVVSMPTADPDQLMLSGARNLGYRVARADVTIFLDVDCAPTVSLVADYVTRVVARPGVWSGPVGYLPPAACLPPDQEAPSSAARFPAGRPHPGQPDARLADPSMFWSLSFALDRRSWRAIGGFDERFRGYGGEDTDFSRSATKAAVPLLGTGTAVAHHQHHPVSSPPVEHLGAVCRNARVFHDKWGSWPMGGWLSEFARMGLIEWDPAGGLLRARAVASPGKDRVQVDRPGNGS